MILFYDVYSISMSRIYINLPVHNLQASEAFYHALWFSKITQFSWDGVSAMKYDDTLVVMLLMHDVKRFFLLTKQ